MEHNVKLYRVILYKRLGIETIFSIIQCSIDIRYMKKLDKHVGPNDPDFLLQICFLLSRLPSVHGHSWNIH